MFTRQFVSATIVAVSKHNRRGIGFGSRDSDCFRKSTYETFQMVLKGIQEVIWGQRFRAKSSTFRFHEASLMNALAFSDSF
jgi:hypothetical protein